MASTLNLTRRPGTTSLYARLRVPVDCVDVMGRKELWASTGTGDRKVAKVRAAEIVAGWQRQFDDLRRRRNPVTNDLTAAGWVSYLSGLDRDARERQSFPDAEKVDAAKRAGLAKIAAREERTPLSDLNDMLDYMVARDAPAMARHRNATRLAALRKHLAIGEVALITHAADAFIQSAGLLIEKGSAVYRELCQSLMRAEIQVHERIAERDAGDWTGTPKDPAVRPPEADAAPKVAPQGESIPDLFETYAREQGPRLKATTLDLNRRAVAMLADFIGAGAHIDAIDRKAVREFKAALMCLPTRRGSVKELRDLSIREMVKENERLGRETLDNRTVNRILSSCSAFADWLTKTGHLEVNPFANQNLAVDQKPRRKPFTSEQLAALFQSPLFSRCQGDGAEHKPGNVEVRDWRYWSPLIAIYAGLRAGEILQLRTDDVREDRGIWIFDVNDEGEGQEVKTKSSRRIVPIHAELIRRGFLDFVRARHAGPLFDVKRSAQGYFSVEAHWFAEYFKAVGAKVDRAQTFHSLRHSFADRLREAGYLDEEFGVLLGHGRSTTTARYGALAQGTLQHRKQMIDAISYPGL